MLTAQFIWSSDGEEGGGERARPQAYPHSVQGYPLDLDIYYNLTYVSKYVAMRTLTLIYYTFPPHNHLNLF